MCSHGMSRRASTPLASSPTRTSAAAFFFLFAAHLGALRADASFTCDGSSSGSAMTASASGASENAFSRLRGKGWFRETGTLAFTHDVDQEEDGSAYGYPGGMIYGE